MGLWDWALAAYARPGVPEACLILQDEHGQNVSFLLWAAWAEVRDPAVLARAAHVAEAWEAAVLGPLREVRRGLKPPFPPVGDLAREGLRADVKAVELRAERVLLETLGGLAGPERGGEGTFAALHAASAAWSPPAPDAPLAALARALSRARD